MTHSTTEAKTETAGSGMSRKAYEKKFQARFDQWRAKVDELSAKACESAADSKIKSGQAVEEVRRKFKTYVDDLKKLKNAGGDAWRDVAEGCEQSWHAFKESLDRAKRHFG